MKFLVIHTGCLWHRLMWFLPEIVSHWTPVKQVIIVVYCFRSSMTVFISGGKGGLEGFEDFMYKNIVPACFMAPVKPTFDLGDAQTILVRNIIV